MYESVCVWIYRFHMPLDSWTSYTLWLVCCFHVIVFCTSVVHLSILGKRIPHLWIFIRLLIYLGSGVFSKLFFTWFEALRAAGVISVCKSLLRDTVMCDKIMIIMIIIIIIITTYLRTLIISPYVLHLTLSIVDFLFFICCCFLFFLMFHLLWFSSTIFSSMSCV